MLREEPFCFDFTAQPAGRVTEVELVVGLDARVVSRAGDGSGITVLLEVPAGWNAAGVQAEGTAEVFVLVGALEVDGTVVAGGGYAAIPASSGPTTLSSARGARVLLFWSRTARLEPARLSVWDEPWRLSTLGGSPTGSASKVLRAVATADPLGGPHGGLMLAQLAPGWTSPFLEAHDAWEENLLLRGDLVMLQDGRGVIGAGTNLANPAGYWHGPMASKGGALFLIHCVAPKAVEFRESPGAEAGLRRYLETAPW